MIFAKQEGEKIYVFHVFIVGGRYYRVHRLFLSHGLLKNGGQ